MRTDSFILPSGVEVEMRSMKGSDQDILTKQSNTQNGTQYLKLLEACIIRLGDNEDINYDVISSMLLYDIRYSLWFLRNFSLGWPKEYEFTYTWSSKSKKNHKQKFIFDLDESTFNLNPYQWVRNTEEFKENLKTFEEDIDGSDEPKRLIFPKIHDSYKDIDQYRKQTFKTSEGKTVHWEILTGQAEKNYNNNKSLNDLSINIMFPMRSAKLVIPQANGEKPITKSWSADEAEMLDLENFRKEIRDIEGSVSFIINIENDKDSNQVLPMNLIQNPSFFFPSLAT